MNGLAVSPEIPHRTALRQQEVDPLGAIEGAASAKGDDRIDAFAVGIRPTRLDHIGVGVWTEVAENEHMDAGALEQPVCAFEVPRPREARIGNQQCTREAEFPGKPPELLQHARAKKDARI
jgi:hypothetical protein